MSAHGRTHTLPHTRTDMKWKQYIRQFQSVHLADINMTSERCYCVTELRQKLTKHAHQEERKKLMKHHVKARCIEMSRDHTAACREATTSRPPATDWLIKKQGIERWKDMPSHPTYRWCCHLTNASEAATATALLHFGGHFGRTDQWMTAVESLSSNHGNWRVAAPLYCCENVLTVNRSDTTKTTTAINFIR